MGELVLKSGLSQFTQIAYIIPFMCSNVLENLCEFHRISLTHNREIWGTNCKGYVG